MDGLSFGDTNYDKTVKVKIVSCGKMIEIVIDGHVFGNIYYQELVLTINIRPHSHAMSFCLIRIDSQNYSHRWWD